MLVVFLAVGCHDRGPVLDALEHGAGPEELAERLASSEGERAARRAYDGAPPVIPHDPMGADCLSCHGAHGVAVAGVGFSPASPHGETPGMGAARCHQCHVYRQTRDLFVASDFEPLRQDFEPAPRAHELAPPRMPHRKFMRENCQACHAGPAAREAIRTTHPERVRCEQCHVEKADG